MSGKLYQASGICLRWMPVCHCDWRMFREHQVQAAVSSFILASRVHRKQGVTDGPSLPTCGSHRLEAWCGDSKCGLWLQVPKPERKAAAAEILQDVKPSRTDLYLPVNAHARVLDVIASSATPMQSAAKVTSSRQAWRRSVEDKRWTH